MADMARKTFNMEEFIEIIKKIARPFIRKTLDETNDPDWYQKLQQEWKESGWPTLMPDEQEMREIFEEEMDEACEESPKILVSDWLQFIHLALNLENKDNKLALILDNLAPYQSDVSEELWESYTRTSAGIALKDQDASSILKEFAANFLNDCDRVDLPANISIYMIRNGGKTIYVAYLRATESDGGHV